MKHLEAIKMGVNEKPKSHRFTSFANYKKRMDAWLKSFDDSPNKRVCKKSLYKSTYQGHAFIKGKSYPVTEENDTTIWLRDEENREFNFTKAVDGHSYVYIDYFE